MFTKQVPPYLVGLPQWPGSSQTPSSGQAFAEWHADKTQTVGADTFAEDVCGDFFPPNGLPQPTYGITFNGSDDTPDVYIKTDIPCDTITSLEIVFKFNHASTSETILGAWTALANAFRIATQSATTFRYYYGNTVTRYITWTVANNDICKLIITDPTSSTGSMLYNLTTGVTSAGTPSGAWGSSVTIGKNIAIGINNANDVYAASSVWTGTIFYVKITTTTGTREYNFNTAAGGFVFDTAGTAYPISGTLTNIWSVTESTAGAVRNNYKGFFALPSLDTHYVYSYNPLTENYEYTLLSAANGAAVVMVIPWKTGIYSACYTKSGSDYIPVACTYLGRSQFPVQIHTNGLIFPACYESNVIAELPLGGTRLWANVTTDWDNAHKIFCNRATSGLGDTWTGVDNGIAFISARTTGTSPTLAEVGGYLGI